MNYLAQTFARVVIGSHNACRSEIVRVTSPLDRDVTRGRLCIKGRFGWQFVQNRWALPDHPTRRRTS
jgi:predicted molibdopterin-dependent oxidoreductase YjgC